MKIGFLTAEFVFGDNHRGGLGNYLKRITYALAKAGHEPHVFYYADAPAVTHNDSGVYIHTINNRSSRLGLRLNWATRNQLRQTLIGVERALRFRWHLKVFLDKYPLDILQTSSSSSPGLLAPNELPMVVRGNSYQPLVDKYEGINATFDRKLFVKLEALQYRRARGVFTPTQMLADLLKTKLGLQDVQVIRTPYYVETPDVDESLYRKYLSEKDYILFFGKLSPLKGAHILAEALPLVWKQYPNLHVAFIGEDRNVEKNLPMSEFIRRKSKGFEHNLQLFPLLPHRLLYPVLLHARLVVLPSLFDNSPNTMLEAMGFGKPVIGTYGSSMEEFIEDGISGFLVQKDNAKELAEKICYVWSRSDLDQVGQAAKKVIAKHSPDEIIPQLIKFYQVHV